MDEQVLLWINQGWAHPWLDVFFTWVSRRATFSLPLLGLIGLVCHHRHGRDGLKLWGLLVLAIVIGDQIGNLLKAHFHLPRPCAVIFDLIRQPGRTEGGSCLDMLHGMPSNHALNFFLAAAFMTATASWRWALFLGPIAVAVGISRVYLGVHYPSHVLAGAAIGCTLGLLAAYLARKNFAFVSRIRRPPRNTQRHEQPAT